MFESLAGKNVALLWSGGLDSTLLLAMLRESSPVDFSILTFRQHWSRIQAQRADKLIRDWDLKTFSYPASRMSLIGKDDEISAVFEVGLGDGVFPVVTDLIDGDRCIEDIVDRTMERAPFQFDIHIVGSRAADRHFSLNDTPPIPAERWMQNGTEIWAPLYAMDRETVKRELRARGLDDTEVSDTENTGSLHCCHTCIKGTEEVFCPKRNKMIDSVAWDRQTNLAQFQLAYGS